MQNWNRAGASGNDVARFQRTFPDGTDVILVIRRVGNAYEVVSSAESRTSGPSEAAHGVFATVAEATQKLEEEAAAWERDLG